jgi:hypothetical protein
MSIRSDFSPAELWQGCVLATIAHAIFTAGHPELANEQSWDGFSYNIQDSQGSLGTITFAEEGTVGAFFDSHSSRNPFSSGEPYDMNSRLVEMPADLRALAEHEALQYLIQDYNGADVPLITTAFWSEGDFLAAAEPWADVFSNGAHLVQTQLRRTDESIGVWRSHYGLTSSQVGLLRSLFARKVAASEAPIILTSQEKAALLERGSQGLDQSRALLAEVAVTVP